MKFTKSICFVAWVTFLIPHFASAQSSWQTIQNQEQAQQQADTATLQRRLGALQANQQVLNQLIFEFSKSTIGVPFAKPEAIFEKLQREAQAQYERDHPLLPSGNGWTPPVDQQDYDAAIRESDGRLAQPKTERKRNASGNFNKTASKYSNSSTRL